jgi:hypothetical protein
VASTLTSSAAQVRTSPRRSGQAAVAASTAFDSSSSERERVVVALALGALTDPFLSSDLRVLMLHRGMDIAREAGCSEAIVKEVAGKFAVMLASRTSMWTGFMG